ncbi:MAG: gamma-glutamyltransferase [Gemmatimonadetes bacterium]|nr:gamma-glutamyltransferase [Gemmatimonadota bacterium]
MFAPDPREPLVAPPEWRLSAQGRVAEGPEAIVVSNSMDASRAGDEILREGGNAVDAAVATGFALAASHPIAGNLGGGGFMVIRLGDGRAYALDFRETAPAAATRNMFLGPDGKADPLRSRHGHLASGVPGSVAGLAEAQRRFGTMPLARVIAPAIRIAEQGFVVDSMLSLVIARTETYLKPWNGERFFRADGTPLRVGDTLRQPELARTLARIAERGPREFYEGETADLLVAEMQRGRGIITKRDLAGYQAVWREPLRGHYKGFEIVTMPPPSAGGIVMLETLNVMSGVTPMPPFGSSSAVHLLAETFRRAYVERNTLVADPDFVRVPVAALLAPGHADSLRASIDLARATPSPATLSPVEGQHTTHYITADRSGMIVSTSTTINDLMGSKVVVKGAGFLLNDEMDDFAAAPGRPNLSGLVMGERNAVQPGKRMLSSMTPTIVAAPDGTPFMAAGAAGGSRISTTVTQIVFNVLEHRMGIADALRAPRIHHQAWPDRLQVERNGFSKAVRDSLAAKGHALEEADAIVNAMGILRLDGRWQGVPEPRREGGAVAH